MNAYLNLQDQIAVAVSRPVPVYGPAFAILAESPDHIAAREALLDRAMGEGRFRKSSEKLRRGRLPAEGLAFAALDERGALVGTVRLWNVVAGCDATNKSVTALMLGPLAVDPFASGLGIGSALMRKAIAMAKALGHGAILLVGDPEYYERFGFTAQRTGNLAMPGPFEKRRLLALELKAGHLAGAHGVLRASGRKIVQSCAA